MKYRVEIDGLRSIAILPVVFFHAGFEFLSGGFVGVDVFFVISGYLITTLILMEKDAGKYSIATFYERRARRILPALFVVLMACVPFVWLWMLPADLEAFSESMVSVSLFSSNIFFWRESGYFDTASELKPLLHTWSLAVEEQYYVFFPLVILAFWRLGKRGLFILLLAGGALSLGLAHYGSVHHPNPTFYLLPTRLWEILIGSLSAFYLLYWKAPPETSHRWFGQVMATLGLAMIVYSVISFDSSTPFPSLWTLFPTLGTAFVIVWGTLETYVGRVLANRLLVGIGLISYSTYLWHQPLFAFARLRSRDEPEMWLMLLLGLASFGVAWLVYRFVERPFRDRARMSRRAIAWTSAVITCVTLAVGSAGAFSGGFEERVAPSGTTYAELDLTRRLRINSGLGTECSTDFTTSSKCRTSDEPELVVWGDSYAMHLVPGILASNPGAKLVQMTRSECGPFAGVAPTGDAPYTIPWAEACLNFNDSVVDYIRNTKSIKYAVLASTFGSYINSDLRLLTHDGILEGGFEQGVTHFQNTISILESLGIRTLVVAPTPGNKTNIGKCLSGALQFGYPLDECNFDKAAYNVASRDVIDWIDRVAEFSNVMRLNEQICDSNVCHASISNVLIFRDSGHLSFEGSEYLGLQHNWWSLIVGNPTPHTSPQ